MDVLVGMTMLNKLGKVCATPGDAESSGKGAILVTLITLIIVTREFNAHIGMATLNSPVEAGEAVHVVITVTKILFPFGNREDRHNSVEATYFRLIPLG